MGVKLYNKFLNHLKSLGNVQVFRNKLKFIFIAADYRWISIILWVFIMENVSVYDEDFY